MGLPPPSYPHVEVLPDPARRWLPASVAQKAALDCPADILLMGGSLGSLKTSTMLVDLIQERSYPTMRSYFFRRTYSEMEGGDGAIDQSAKLFSQTGATYNGSSHTWTWPSGAEFYFRHAQHEKDIFQYQGHAMSALGIDEVTHWPEKMVKYLVTRNRSTDPNITTRVRFGTNPGNIGNKWCKQVFFDGVCPHCHPEQAPTPGAPRTGARWLDGQPLSIVMENGEKVDLSVAYILSSVRDHSMYPKEYLARIKMQSPATAKALLEGCWDIFEGQFFDVFDPNRGINLKDPKPGAGPMVVPRAKIGEQWWWPMWVASDYGFTVSVSAAHLAVHQPASPGYPRGRVFIVDEVECQETAKNFADLLLKRWVLGDDGNPIERRWMPWYLSPDSFREIGIGFTLAGQMNEVLRPYGIQFSRADNDRVGGAMKMYTGFETGELVICAECPKLIAAIQSRTHDDKNENDVKKISGETDDDEYDSARYLYKSFETARGVKAPIEIRLRERMEEQWKSDPTSAMFNAQKIREEERSKGKPQPGNSGGSAARRRIAAFERSRRS